MTFPIYGEIKKIFQTTNQYIYSICYPIFICSVCMYVCIYMFELVQHMFQWHSWSTLICFCFFLQPAHMDLVNFRKNTFRFWQTSYYVMFRTISNRSTLDSEDHGFFGTHFQKQPLVMKHANNWTSTIEMQMYGELFIATSNCRRAHGLTMCSMFAPFT